MRRILDFRFWISLLGVLLIACSTTLIWFLLRKKESKSNLLPTLGFDALQPSLKAVYIKTTLWEVKYAHFGTQSHRLAREFRRALFDLQALTYPDPPLTQDIRALEQLIEQEPDDDTGLFDLAECLQQFRNQKKEPDGSHDFVFGDSLEVEA